MSARSPPAVLLVDFDSFSELGTLIHNRLVLWAWCARLVRLTQTTRYPHSTGFARNQRHALLGRLTHTLPVLLTMLGSFW